jgi:sterol desaturase/sphingolipid hydroxylase (fatty acid hydroxylase superfamily)
MSAQQGDTPMNSTQNLILVLIITGFGLAEYLSKRYKTFGATRDDAKLELVMFIGLVALVQPGIFFVTTRLGKLWFPQYQGALAHWPVWAMVLVLLVGDDMTQYWWHRLSHTPLLWPLHRAHHTAHYMSIRITYRNNFFYYLMMPGLWVSGVLIYLGFANVYLVYVVIKLTVIMGAHCAVRWDEPLYRIKALRPLVWVLERTISTPATHWAHHAMSNQDGVGHYKGNFGNLLFVWDMLFGSAHITRRYPPQVGLKDDQLFGKERWFVEMFYPLIRSKREHSALTPGGKIYAEEETAMPRAPVAT